MLRHFSFDVLKHCYKANAFGEAFNDGFSAKFFFWEAKTLSFSQILMLEIRAKRGSNQL